MTDQRILNRAASKKVRGRPIVTPETKGFQNVSDFQEQLIANRADRSITQRQRNVKETKLVQQRHAQLGGR